VWGNSPYFTEDRTTLGTAALCAEWPRISHFRDKLAAARPVSSYALCSLRRDRPPLATESLSLDSDTVAVTQLGDAIAAFLLCISGFITAR
jgi:hypothetical protein